MTRTQRRTTDMREVHWAVLGPFAFVAFTIGLLAIGAG
jgi:hypothetical protein